jgi:prepilin-type processing-associated H-X9-DG protein
VPKVPPIASQTRAKLHRFRSGRIASVLAVCLIIAMPVWLLLGLPSPPVSRVSPTREKCRGNLKQIGLALQNYHSAHGCFPPAHIADDQGRPIHSWRVLILPYLEERTLYDEYRFDEPWNGPNNSRLANRPPRVFNCPKDVDRNGRANLPMTSYLAVVGPDTVWPAEHPTTISDITDGTPNTIHVVEVAHSGINWLEPRDLPLSELVPPGNSPPLKGMPSGHTGGSHVLFADGSVKFISETVPSETLRALLTRNRGETVGDF